MCEDVLIYTEGHQRGFRISLSLSLESVEELVRQALMRVPNDPSSAHQLAEYRAQRREATRSQLTPLTSHLPLHLREQPPLPRTASGVPQEMEGHLVDMDHLAPPPEQHLPPPPTRLARAPLPSGLTPARGSTRTALRGRSQLGVPTSRLRSSTAGSTVSLQVPASRLRAVGDTTLSNLEGQAFAQGVGTRTRSGQIQ